MNEYIKTLLEMGRRIVGYYLDGKIPKPCYDINDWALKMEFRNRVVKQTKLQTGEFISTVFLGIDHSFNFYDENHVPILFETMVFINDQGEDTYRYATWDEAEEGHEKAIRKILLNYSNNHETIIKI